MAEDHENEAGLREIPASEILVKILKGESVEYDHVLIKSDLDIDMFYSTKKKEERLVNSPIKITNSRIQGNVKFRDIIFKQQINFESTQFKWHADFSGTTFSRYADFSRATFREISSFSGATFSRDANFSEAMFSRDTDFSEATFSEDATFSKAMFREIANFRGATFLWDAYFNEAMFRWDTEFGGATFSRDAYFREATFSEDANFRGTTFSGYAAFRGATFREIANVSEKDQLIGLASVYSRRAKRKLIGFKTNKEWNITELQVFVTSISDIYNIFLAKRISEGRKITLLQAFQNIDTYSKENQVLNVYRIEMGSPGGFSFLGLPQIIEEIRITLKWLDERELERAEKCLDLVKKYLEIKDNNKGEDVDDLIKKFCKGVKIFEELESKGKLDKITENFDYIPNEGNEIFNDAKKTPR